MPEDARPDPEALLAEIRRQSEQSRRGRLKIFFGMCPGVGKTYAMLQAALQKKAEGVEVLAGIVETHGRRETEAMIGDMPVVPRAKITHRDTVLDEMDLDAILLWHPPLVLVDELAHTNAPGSRHPKRYQDVLELLEAGIDVYTTLNVQHVESRKDTVQQITGVEVRETVPDSLLDLASEITLIDLTPSQLRARLAEGRVYLGDRAAVAAGNFFKESNLIALREMALRLTAEHVDRDLRQIKPMGSTGPWKAGDRLLVAISASPSSEKLIRWTRRAAATMEASWLAVYVETPRSLGTMDEVRLALNIALARELGAEVVMTESTDVGAALLRVARQHNASQIIVGKPGPRTLLHYFRTSPVDWLVRNSGDIDVHMVRAGDGLPRERHTEGTQFLTRPREYMESLGIAAAVTLLALALLPVTGYWAIALIYLLAVIVSAMRLSRWPTLFLAGISALLWDFLFIPPRFTFFIIEIRDFMMFGMYFITAIIVGHLTTRLREREEAERRGEARSTALYRLLQSLASSHDPEQAMAMAVQQVKGTFGAECALLVRDEQGIFSGVAHPASTLPLSAKEESVAGWAFQKKQAAGRFTDTLPDSEALHLPLLAGGNVEGVLAVKLHSPISFQQRELLEAFSAQIALALEKNRLAQASRKALINAQSEKLQRTLFDSVSHELKTPLAAITTALEQTVEKNLLLDEIRKAVIRLTSVVDHLLDMTRLDSGRMKPHFEWCDPGELVRESMEHVAEKIRGHPLKLEIQADLPPVRVDAALMQQVIAMLVSNAADYSAAGSEITVKVSHDGARFRVQVADRGPGLKEGEELRIFEKFHRSPGTPAGGIGLGLSIAQRLVEAHAGSIKAENRTGGGAIFTVELPATERLQLPGEEQAA